MAVVEEDPIASSVANGVTTSFPFSFSLRSAADLVVTGTLDGIVTTYSLGVHYTVSGVGGGSGSADFLAAPASGTIITRYRRTQLVRSTDYQDNGDLPADTLNADFDRLWQAVQELDSGSRAPGNVVRAPAGESIAELPPASERANTWPRFGPEGQLLLDPADPSTSAALIAGTFDLTLNYVAGTLGARLGETVSVTDYPFLAKCDGTTDDSAAVQAAVTYLGTRGGGTLTFPAGKTCRIVTPILVSFGNIDIVGYGATIDARDITYSTTRGDGAVFRFVSPAAVVSTTLTVTGAADADVITVASTAGVQAGDLARSMSTQEQYRNDTAIANFNDQNVVATVISGTQVRLETPLEYPLTVSPWTVSVQFYRPITNITVRGLRMIGGGIKGSLANSLGQAGIWATGVRNVQIIDCAFLEFQGMSIGFDRFADVTVRGCYMQGIPAGVTVVENDNSGFYGAYAIRGRRAIFSQCTGVRLRHMYDASEVYDMVQSDSVAIKTHRAAFGSHEETYNLVTQGCVSEGCYAGFVTRSLTSQAINNCFQGCTTAAITTSVMLATGSPGQLILTGNRLQCSATTLAAINVTGVFDRLLIQGNIIESAFVGVQFETQAVKNASVIGNTFQAPNGIVMPLGVLQIDGLLIQSNTFLNYTGSMVVLRGAANPSAPADRIRICDNFGMPVTEGSGNGIILRGEGYYGDRIVVSRNAQWGDSSNTVGVASNNSQFYRFKAYPVLEGNDETLATNQANRSIGYFGAATAPAGSTLMRGMRLERTNPVSGAPDYWIVTASGTEGTITGVTGSINSGTTTLTLTGNDATKVYAGSWITVTGAGPASGNLVTRVASVSDDFATATLESSASTTVSGASVTRRNPTISAAANLV